MSEPKYEIMPRATRKVLNEIAYARSKQDIKWGEQNHSLERWLAILGEEYGEACRAVLELKPIKETIPGAWDLKLREELIQIAAVAAAFLEYLQRIEK